MPILDHSWTIALSGRDINSRLLGGSSFTYTVDPALQGSGSTSLTIRATLSGDCTRFLYVVSRGAAAPSKTTIETSGQSFAASSGVVDDAQYTGLADSTDYDVYEFSRNAGGQETEVKGPVQGSTSQATSFQLPSTSWEPSVFALRMVTVRPSGERSADSRYLWAMPNEVYEVPIGCVGGAWPFNYELISAPTGATIGSFLEVSGDTLVPPSNYGVIRWTAPSSGTHDFHVRVTDQEGTTVEATWTVAVDSSKFIWVSPSGSGSTGSKASPISLSTAFGSLSTTSTYPGKFLIFRGGNYTLPGFSDANDNLQLNGNLKPKVWLAYDGEAPDINCSSSKVTFNGGSMSDSWFEGISFGTPKDTIANAHFFSGVTVKHRCLWWRNNFSWSGQTAGTSGTSNPACIYLSAAGLQEDNAVIGNSFDGLPPGSTNGVSGVDSYDQRYLLLEANEYTNCTSLYMAWRKGPHQQSTRRREIAVTGINTTHGALDDYIAGIGSGNIPSTINETCWCKVVAPSAYRTHASSTGSYSGNGVINMHTYRNTFEGGISTLRPDATGECLRHFTRNVFTDTALPTGAAVTYTDNVTVSGGGIDASGNLSGSTRNAHLGLRGAEVTN